MQCAQVFLHQRMGEPDRPCTMTARMFQNTNLSHKGLCKVAPAFGKKLEMQPILLRVWKFLAQTHVMLQSTSDGTEDGFWFSSCSMNVSTIQGNIVLRHFYQCSSSVQEPNLAFKPLWEILCKAKAIAGTRCFNSPACPFKKKGLAKASEGCKTSPASGC